MLYPIFICGPQFEIFKAAYSMLIILLELIQVNHLPHGYNRRARCGTLSQQLVFYLFRLAVYLTGCVIWDRCWALWLFPRFQTHLHSCQCEWLGRFFPSLAPVVIWALKICWVYSENVLSVLRFRLFQSQFVYCQSCAVRWLLLCWLTSLESSKCPFCINRTSTVVDNGPGVPVSSCI